MKLEDRDKPLFYVGLAIVGLLLVVVFWRQPLFARPWVDPACGEHSLECFFYTWQTFIAGILAILGAYLTISQMRRASTYARYTKFQARMQDYEDCNNLIIIFDDLISNAAEKLRILKRSPDLLIKYQDCPVLDLNPESAPRKEFGLAFFNMYVSAAKDSSDYRSSIIKLSESESLRASYAIERANKMLRTIEKLRKFAETHLEFGAEEIQRWNSTYPKFAMRIELVERKISNTKAD